MDAIIQFDFYGGMLVINASVVDATLVNALGRYAVIGERAGDITRKDDGL